MYIHNIFKSALALLASAFAFASCMQVEEAADGAVGYLSAPTLDVDVTVEDLIDTKATVDFFAEAPNLADVHFLVKDKDGAVKHDAKGLWETMRMPVGKYSIEAAHGSNGFGAPYFYAKTADDAYIDAYEDEKPVLNLQLANALLRVSVPETFAEHFTLEKVTLAASGFNTVEVSAAEISVWYYVPADVEITVTIIGRNSAGNDKSFEKTVTLAAKSARTVVCGDNAGSMPSIQLDDQSAGAWANRLYVTPATFTNISAANQAKVVYEVSASGNWDDTKTSEVIMDAAGSATAYHVVKGLENGKTYSVRARVGNLLSDNVITDVKVQENLPGAGVTMTLDKPDGLLSGTKVDLNLGLSGIVQDLMDDGLLKITESTLTMDGNTVVRTAPASGTLMAVANDYPYLPHKSGYQLKIVHKLVNDESFETSLSDAVAPKPDVTVSLGMSWTSYDKGVGDNGFTKTTASVTEANALTGSDVVSIFDVSASWPISESLMKDSKYGGSANIYLKQNGTVKSTFTPTTLSSSYNVGKIPDLAWGQYSLEAAVEFDGLDATDSKIHHITGLPYSALPTIGGGWTEDRDGKYETTFSWGTSEFYMLNTSGSGNTMLIGSPIFHVPEDIMTSIVVSAHGYRYGIDYDVTGKVHDGANSEEFKATANKNTYKDYPINSLTLNTTTKKIQIENTHNSGLYRRLYINKVTINYR